MNFVILSFIYLNSLVFLLNFLLIKDYVIILSGNLHYLNYNYIISFLFFTIFIILYLCWLFHKKGVVYLSLYIILCIQVAILVSLTYASTLPTDNLIAIDNLISIHRSFTTEELLDFLLKIQPRISLEEAKDILQNLNHPTPQGILDFFEKKNGNISVTNKNINSNQEFLIFIGKILVISLMFIRLILLILIENQKTLLQKKYYTITTNPFINAYLGMRLLFLASFQRFRNSSIYKEIFLNKITRPITSEIEYFAQSFGYIEDFIVDHTPKKIKIFLSDKLLLFIAFIGIWSILWIKYNNSIESVLTAPALFSILHYMISFFNILYIYFKEIEFSKITDKKTLLTYLVFPFWILLNRIFFLYLFISSL